MKLVSLLLALLVFAPLGAWAKSKRHVVVLLASPGGALQRTADELAAASFIVVTQSVTSPNEATDYEALVARHAALAAVHLEGDSVAGSASIFIVDASRSETTLKRIEFGSGAGRTADSVLALRVVEVLNAALIELGIEPNPVPAARHTRPTRSTAAHVIPEAPPQRGERARAALRGGAQISTLSGSLPSFWGPVLGARLTLSSGWVFEADGFLSLSQHQLHSLAGSANVGLALLRAGAGYRALRLGRWNVTTLLHAGAAVSFARGTPAPGFHAQASRTLSLLLAGGADLTCELGPWLRAGASLSAGAILPELTLRLAEQASGRAGPLLASGTLALSGEWEL